MTLHEKCPKLQIKFPYSVGMPENKDEKELWIQTIDPAFDFKWRNAIWNYACEYDC